MTAGNDNELPRTRAEAKAAGVKQYFTGEPCKHGHVAPRYVSSGGCIVCTKQRRDAWAGENPEKIREMDRSWRNRNPLRVKELKDADYKKHKEKRDATSAEWKLNNPDKILSYSRRGTKKRRSTPKGRLSHTISSGVRRGLKNGEKAGRGTFDLLGYTVDQLKSHLERKFLPGMTWDNFGKDGWHIDHVVPLAAHNYETPDDLDFKRAWSLKNLQPLWGVDNLKKNAKIDGGFQPSLLIANHDNHHS